MGISYFSAYIRDSDLVCQSVCKLLKEKMGNENKINNVTIALPTERPPKQLTDRPIIKTYKVASLIRISQVIASLKKMTALIIIL